MIITSLESKIIKSFNQFWDKIKKQPVASWFQSNLLHAMSDRVHCTVFICSIWNILLFVCLFLRIWFQKAMFFCRLNMSTDLMSLHIGDRILEVNGTPVKDQPVENIENLLRYSDTVLQVCTQIRNKFKHLNMTEMDVWLISDFLVDDWAWSRFSIPPFSICLHTVSSYNS